MKCINRYDQAMVFFVLMGFSTSDDSAGTNGVNMERVLDFGTADNFDLHEGDSFDNTLHIIDDYLPAEMYIDDGFPEPVRFLCEEDVIDRSEVIVIPIQSSSRSA